jgi:hypothetical protein
VGSQFGEEFRAGVALFEKVSSNHGLSCAWKSDPGDGRSGQFALSKDGKELRIALRLDFVTDLPGTRELQTALESYLTELSLRFAERNLSEYATMSGIPTRLRIGFPFRTRTPANSFESVHVLVQSGTDPVFEARLSVDLTEEAAINIASFESIVTETLVVNAVRKSVDSKQAVFYQKGDHPEQIQPVTIASSDYDHKAKRFTYCRATEEEITDFLKRKVYWLGFRRGNQTTRVCIASPYDAAYLGVSTERLQQTSAILAADGFVQLDASGVYANAGTKLLQEARIFDRQLAALLGERSQNKGAVQQPSGTATPGGTTLFDVFVSHATEDKPYVDPLVRTLEAAGIRVWYDKIALEWGDDLRPGIDRGLANCRYGIVVFSKAFLGKKKWTEYELNSLFALEQPNRKIILPIWHGVTRDDLLKYGAAFADRLAKPSTDSNEDIAESVLALLGRPKPRKPGATYDAAASATKPAQTKPNAIAYAWYETTGSDAVKAQAFIRPSTQQYGRFTFEDSFGEEDHGTKDEIALRFASFDRSLKLKHYIRMQHATSDPAFSLPG